jgi:uncharacterized protein YcbK (DUF882 family)
MEVSKLDTYTLIKRDGTRIAKPFIIKDGKEYISAHIPRWENAAHTLGLAEHSTGKVVIFEPLIDLFETLRSNIGKAIIINSGYRSDEYQKMLYEQDLRDHRGEPSGKVAKPGHSPHATGAAMDLSVPWAWKAAYFARTVRVASNKLSLPPARCGYKKYGGSFIHVDLVHMLYHPYIKGIPNPAPAAWLSGVTW